MPRGSSGPCSRVRSRRPWVRIRSTSLKLASIGQARVCADQDDVEFQPQGEDGEVPQVHQRRQEGRGDRPSGPRPGRPSVPRGKQDITAVEAVMPPLIIGVIIGFLWTIALLDGRRSWRSGEEIEITRPPPRL